MKRRWKLIYLLKYTQKDKQNFLNNQQGGILLIVLVSIFLLELSLFGTFRIYQNKIHTYETLVHHYQSQTLFAYTEKIIKDDFISSDKKAPSILSFSIGEVRIVSISPEQYLLTSQLTSGFSEQKEVTIVKTTPASDMQEPEESESKKVSLLKKQGLGNNSQSLSYIRIIAS